MGIVWERTNAIISMEAAHKGAHQDTKETDAKISVPLAILELTVCTNVALSVEEMPRAIISREYAMTVAKKDGAVLCVEKERQVASLLFFPILFFKSPFSLLLNVYSGLY